jgi:hypothetical protein
VKGWLVFVMVLVSANATAFNISFPGLDYVGRMLLLNDTIKAHNSRSIRAIQSNMSYTTPRQSCELLEAGDEVLTYDGRLDLNQHLVLCGVEPPEVFTEGLAIQYALNPTYFDPQSNNTFLKGDTLEVIFSTGCQTREMGVTWDNFCPETPGTGYHREYLPPIIETITVYVGDSVCLNKTLIHGSSFIESMDSLGIHEIECKAPEKESFSVRLEQSCEAHLLLDSAYLVFGWVKRCDRDSYIKSCLRECKGPPQMCQSHCASMATQKCATEYSPKAQCDTPPSGTYGTPHDGSSEYFILKPPEDPSDPCGCRYYPDYDNNCMNNRLTRYRGLIQKCSDEKTIILFQNTSTIVFGSYLPGPQRTLAEIRVNAHPDIISAYIIGDILYSLETPTPRHSLYKLENTIGPGIKALSLREGLYSLNLSRDDGGYISFVNHEMAPVGIRQVISNTQSILNHTQEGLNHTIWVAFYGENISGKSVGAIALDQRLNNEGPPCNNSAQCPPSHHCLDNKCISLKDYPENTYQLTDVLAEKKQATLTIKQENTGENTIILAKLTSHGAGLSERVIRMQCPDFALESLTGGDAVASFKPDSTRRDMLCHIGFKGDGMHWPASAQTIIFAPSNHSIQPLKPLAGIIVLFAIVTAASGGQRKLVNVWENLRGLTR